MRTRAINLTDKNQRILVIDDNRAIHDDFRKIISPAGAGNAALADVEAELFGETVKGEIRSPFQIDSVYQGQEGVEAVRKALEEGHPYAMAFVDVRMPPGIDGVATTQRIWEIDSEIQIVICTAYSDYSWEEMFEKIGNDDRMVVLKKPFDTVEALQLVHTLTEKWRLSRDYKRTIEDLERIVAERTGGLRQANEALVSEIDERKKAEAEQHRMEIQLRQAQKLESIGQLAAGIAHEINTPTQYISDNTHFLQTSFHDLTGVLRQQTALVAAAKTKSISDDQIALAEETIKAADLDYLLGEIPKAIDQSLKGLECITKIVRSMKDFSHPSNNVKEMVNLNRSIEATVDVCRNEWKYVAEVVLELDPDLPPVLCLQDEINQTVLNIIINATHAVGDVVAKTEARGTITISTGQDDNWAEIRIHDTGTGIPESARDRIFDPFFTTKELGKGTGQGLAIAYAIITQKHNGTIAFETEIGKGTVFIIRLPLAASRNGDSG